MKKFITPLLILICSVSASAQMSPAVIDSLSSAISGIEKMTEGKTYKDAKGAEHTLRFPAKSFILSSSNRLASKAVYKKHGDNEILAVTENIDLSKVTGISVNDDHKGVAYIQLDFPKGQLKTQLFRDGKNVGSQNDDYLEFFCLYGKVDANKEFYFDKQFMTLYKTVMQLKAEKKLVDKQAAREELKAWNASHDGFAAQFPNSILNAQLEKKRIEQEKLQPQIAYISQLAARYGLKQGLTPEQYAAYNPASAFLFKKSVREYIGTFVYTNTKASGNPFPAGPYVITVDSRTNTVKSFTTIIYSGKAEDVAGQIEAFKKDLFANIDQKYIVVDGSYINVDVPNALMKVTFNLFEHNGWQAFGVLF
jgi:hypothetical protein